MTGCNPARTCLARASPTQNGLEERFIRTLKEEPVDYSEYTGFDDAFRQINHWWEVTNVTERIHQALGDHPLVRQHGLLCRHRIIQPGR